jgi:myo-inositol-1(or 4)-monophosphatase
LYRHPPEQPVALSGLYVAVVQTVGKGISVIDLDEVRGWVREGGELARQLFNRVQPERKADRSLVTAADLEVERLLRARIAARFPAHGIIGEEGGANAVEREFVWCIDPIDGTGAFVAGLPTWSISVGLLRDGMPHTGVVLLPMLNDCYWADATGPAFRNDTPIRVSERTSVDVNDWIAVPSTAHRTYQISFAGKSRCLSSVAADCCYVARGSALGGLIGRASIWDLAAGFAILRAAGAALLHLSGAPLEIPPLLDGRRLPEALVIAPPALLEPIRAGISRLP